MTRRRLRRPPPVAPQNRRRESNWRWFVLASALPLAFAAQRLQDDLWFDESYTIENFVSKPLATIVTSYPVPNNHVMYSVFLRPWRLAGEDELILRLPGLLFVIATLACTFRVGLKWSGLATACTAVVWMGLNVSYQVHAMQVRGYGMSMALVALLLDAATPRDPFALAPMTRTRGVIIALAGAALSYVMPTNVAFLAPLAAAFAVHGWLTGQRGMALVKIAAPWVVAFCLGALCYAPIFDQVMALRAARRTGFVELIETARGFTSAIGRDSWLLPVVWLAGMAGSGKTAFTPHRDRLRRAAPWAIMLVGPWLVIAALERQFYLRNLLPLVPIVAVCVGAATSSSVAVAIKRWQPKASAEVALSASMFFAGLPLLVALLTYPARLDRHREAGLPEDAYFQYYAADFHPWEVVEYLADRAADKESYLICFSERDRSDLGYHLARAGLPYRFRKRSATEHTVFLIASGPLDELALEAQCGVPADEFRMWPVVFEAGCYRVLAGKQPQ